MVTKYGSTRYYDRAFIWRTPSSANSHAEVVYVIFIPGYPRTFLKEKQYMLMTVSDKAVGTSRKVFA